MVWKDRGREYSIGSFKEGFMKEIEFELDLEKQVLTFKGSAAYSAEIAVSK